MTTARKLGLIGVTIFFSVLSLPRSSDAQSGGSVFSRGVESYSAYEYGPNGPVLVSSGSNIPATFSFNWHLILLDSYEVITGID